MSVTTSYPGIYIQELPSNAHTIAAAPTSVTVFVGYSHPFKTVQFGVPVELFSFSDYEREFGGFVQSSIIDNNLPYAVSQFFLNGGGDAVVVGLQPTQYYDDTQTPPVAKGAITAAEIDLNTGSIKVMLQEPVDTVPMTVAISNVNGNVADIVVTYGSQQEVYRKVTLDKTKPDFLETRINGVSALITVGPGGSGYPATFTAETQTKSVPPPAGATGVFNPADFNAVFQTDTPLDKWPIFNLLLTPGIVDPSVLSESLAFCERKLAFYIMDPPQASTADVGTNYIGSFTPPTSQNGALYFPYISSNDPFSGAPVELPHSGTVAGICARIDASRGVWKAPAGLETTILNTTGVVTRGLMNDPRQGVLNNLGVNCLRTFPSVGTVVFGARTLVYPNTALRTQWGYVPVRRMALFLEQTLKMNLTWVIFEPNDDPLWVAIRTTIESFMLSLFHQGAFAGTTPSDSFQVKCDATTTTPDDVNNGVVNIVVAFAPLKPAEFVIIKIAQLAGQPQS